MGGSDGQPRKGTPEQHWPFSIMTSKSSSPRIRRHRGPGTNLPLLLPLASSNAFSTSLHERAMPMLVSILA